MKKIAICVDGKKMGVLKEDIKYLVESSKSISDFYDVYDFENPTRFIDSYRKERFEIFEMLTA